MRIINIIKDIQPIRMGVYMAATNTAPALQEHYGVESEIWYPGEDYGSRFPGVTMVSIPGRSIKALQQLITSRNLDPASDIIVTHSPWSYQSGWGRYLAAKGFRWVFLAHGTFQPTYLAQKWLKKFIYYHLYEKRLLAHVSVIRAISTPEKENLARRFPGKEVVLIPNGCAIPVAEHTVSGKQPVVFLYMSRLHHQKHPVQLVQAWCKSSLNNNPHFRLIIAGPDDGELHKLKKVLASTTNAEYAGPVYGPSKENILKATTFFILPSIGEGFPVSVVETAGRGIIPVISEGCNFPELFEQGLGIKTGTSVAGIQDALERCAALSGGEIAQCSKAVQHFMRERYSLERIAQQQYELYRELLGR